MALVRLALFVIVAATLAVLVVLHPAQLFQILAGAVIILSTASTLVFFGFVVRGAFSGVNVRNRARRKPRPLPRARRAAAAKAQAEAPLTPANPS